MKSRHKKLALIGGALAIIGIIAALVLNALNSNIALYITPTDVAEGKAPQGKPFRIGGLVKEGSLSAGRWRDHRLRGHRYRQGHPGPTRASFPTCSRKARARSRQTERPALSSPPKCWPSTTKTTCRRKPPRLSAMHRRQSQQARITVLGRGRKGR
jgi:hypothetical protein